ncbi:MAG: hypothetical protein HYZ25_05855 [Chloroflexi bacterium]|nr:hypothetical protein [Chloroflexota bacterium]
MESRLLCIPVSRFFRPGWLHIRWLNIDIAHLPDTLDLNDLIVGLFVILINCLKKFSVLLSDEALIGKIFLDLFS